MSLCIHATGQGPALVLLHGWGLHSGIWAGVVDALAVRFRVICVDLPGHGCSAGLDRYDLGALAAAVTETVPPQADWLGWSLGGMVALQAALAYPARIRRLGLVATNLRFVAEPDWPHGVASPVLESFAHDLEQDYDRTLTRFLALQNKGGPGAREALRRVRDSMRDARPDTAALHGGLDILRQSDFRERLDALSCPTWWGYGEYDVLVPASVVDAVATRLPGARIHVFRGAGHAPFISHAEEFTQIVSNFFHG